MNTPKELGKIFCDAREKKGLTLSEASEKSLIHIRVIRDIETGVLDRLGKPYLKSFMKKYAGFLGLDPVEILKKYEKVSLKVPVREFSMEDTRDEYDEDLKSAAEKKVQKALIAALSGVLIILVLVLAVKLKSGLTGSRNAERFEKRASEQKPVKEKRKKDVPKKASVPSETKKETPKAEIEKIPEPKPKQAVVPKIETKKTLTLTLRSREEAWAHVTEGEKLLYSGILKPGLAETWKTDGTINVWTGKAEMLDFTVNGQDLGKVASGVVKNIKVSPEGVKIGRNWSARVN
ncbi:MAG: RodZ domain-containing protein [Candidatus Omnitrophota bacterium]